MKLCPAILCTVSLLLGAACVSVSELNAQADAQTAPPPPPTMAPPPMPPGVPVDPLEQLVAPIALYPDVLVGLILPASTSTADIVLAERYLTGGGDPNDVESRAWDPSVKGLAHYPEVIKWLSDNLDWTQQLGAAYANQPQDVMAAIQRARARARANGTLVDTAQQQVVFDGGYIQIIPAQPTVIYVPQYDPEIIFLDQPPDFYPGPLITYGPAWGVGFWLSYGCDWGGRTIWVDRYAREHWRDHRDWRRPEFPHHPGNGPDPRWNPWHPAPNRPFPPRRDIDWAHRPVHHPALPPRAPRIDHDNHGRPVVHPPERRDRPEDRRGAPPPAHAGTPPRALPPGGPQPVPRHEENPRQTQDHPQAQVPRQGQPPHPVSPAPQPNHPPVRPVPGTAPEGTRPSRPAPPAPAQPAQTYSPAPNPHRPAPSAPAPAPQPVQEERGHGQPPSQQFTPRPAPTPAPPEHHQTPQPKPVPPPPQNHPQPAPQQKQQDQPKHDQDKQQ